MIIKVQKTISISKKFFDVKQILFYGVELFFLKVGSMDEEKSVFFFAPIKEKAIARQKKKTVFCNKSTFFPKLHP